MSRHLRGRSNEHLPQHRRLYNPRPKTKAKQKADFDARHQANGATVNSTSVSPDQWAKLEALAEVSKQERKKLDDRGIEVGLSGPAFQGTDSFELQEQFTLGNPPASYEQRQVGEIEGGGKLFPTRCGVESTVCR